MGTACSSRRKKLKFSRYARNNCKVKLAMRQALCASFATHGLLEICGESIDGREAVEKALGLCPDLIIL
jgi:hypothetical protein